MAVLEDLVKQIPTLVWGGLAFWVVYLLRRPFIDLLLPRLNTVKVAGVEMSFVARVMDDAASQAIHHNVVVDSTVKKPVEITRADRERVIVRAERRAGLLKGRRILWIDDAVTNNRLERDMLQAFGIAIEQVQDNAAAAAALGAGTGGYDLIVSDIARPAGEPTGLDFLDARRRRSPRLPLIFYVSVVDDSLPVPLGAFGLTNRPDELLHLVIDALERRP
jgi:CheY-like chemotaxis protein